MLHAALAHVISNVPVTVILDNTKKVSLKIDFVFSTFINSFLVDHCLCSCSRWYWKACLSWALTLSIKKHFSVYYWFYLERLLILKVRKIRCWNVKAIALYETSLLCLAGQQSVSDNAHRIIECLVKLTSYPHLMVTNHFLCISIFCIFFLLPVGLILGSYK